MKRFLITLIMTIMVLPSCAMGEKIILATINLPPFVYYEDGKLTGSDIEIIREVCKQIDVEPEFQVVPFKRLLADVKKGRVSGNFPIHYKKEREEFLYYPSESHNTRKMVILTRKGSQLKMTGLKDLEGKTIAVVAGYDYGPEFNNSPGLKKEICKTDEELLKILIKGRRDFAATEEHVAMHTSRILGFHDELEIIYTLSEDPLYITFSKATGMHGKFLSEKFDRTLRQLKKEGVIQRIINKYQ